jgi:xanthine dehydrogenase accessory factor
VADLALMNESVPNLLRRAAGILLEGRRVAMCLLVRARGSTPASAGALMLVDDAANTFGTIGGGCIEAEVRHRAHAFLGEGRSALLRFKLDHD